MAQLAERLPVGGFDPLDVVGAAIAEYLDGPVGVAGAHGVGQGGDGRIGGESVDPLQDHDVVGQRAVGSGIEIGGGTHDVAQHGAGLDARQLERVAHEDDSGVWAQSPRGVGP